MPNDLGRHLWSIAERMRQLHVPGVSIAYIHDGKVAWARSYGVSRLGGPPVTPKTMFQAGSISKAVTAFGVLRQVQVGKLDLDTDVRSYLKRWAVPDGDFSRGREITLRQILSHTAGFGVHGFAGYADDAPLPTVIQILNGETPANSPPIRVTAAPGSRFEYSGGGYLVAQIALEDALGISFADLMHRAVLSPLGMTRSSFQVSPPRGDVAVPYHLWGAPVRGGAHRYPELAPAGLWSTPSDLARFVIAIQTEGQDIQLSFPLSLARYSEVPAVPPCCSCIPPQDTILDDLSLPLSAEPNVRHLPVSEMSE